MQSRPIRWAMLSVAVMFSLFGGCVGTTDIPHGDLTSTVVVFLLASLVYGDFFKRHRENLTTTTFRGIGLFMAWLVTFGVIRWMTGGAQ